MGGHRGLDLRRINIGAAAQDHVGEPVAQIEIAIGVEPADVAERFPAVGTAFRLGAEIMIGAAGAVDRQKIDFAGLAGRDIVAILADDPKRRGCRRSCRPNPGARAIRRRRSRWRPAVRCRHTVPRFAPARATRSIFPSARAASGLPCETHDFEARQIIGIAHRFRQRPDSMHHGRHEVDPLHPVGLDQAQRLFGIEFHHPGDTPLRRTAPCATR